MSREGPRQEKGAKSFICGFDTEKMETHDLL